MNPPSAAGTIARAASPAEPLRLTAFSHGGGCGCKIAPGVLADILRQSGPLPVPPELLVGIETSDDAAVYQINETQALVATTDFFMPIVDDPFDFGRIAATNAISDVYAMGARPILALALVAMPIDRLPTETIRRILEGGQSACAAAGIPIAGGHTIDSVEPIYGLVAIGLVDPRRLKRNCAARPGDRLVLGKPLGVGILSAALKKEQLPASGYRAMIDSTTRPNTAGIALAELDGVHAMTDVTGFGLLGHALEILRGSALGGTIRHADLPLLEGVTELAAAGCITGASGRNWAGYGDDVDLDPGVDAVAKAVLTDPQTSGGLLVACAPESVEAVLESFRREGFLQATEIGELHAGTARLRVV